MVYLDSSVALAQLLSEDRRPAPDLWQASLISSRLLAFEVQTRLNNMRVSGEVMTAARALLDRVALLELIPEVVARAQEPFPLPVRTLDALHIASASFLLAQGVPLTLATYDSRMMEIAGRLGLELTGL